MRKAITLATHGNSSRITLPRPMMRYLKWHQNEELMATLTADGVIEFMPIETYMRKYAEQLKLDRQQPAATSSRV